MADNGRYANDGNRSYECQYCVICYDIDASVVKIIQVHTHLHSQGNTDALGFVGILWPYSSTLLSRSCVLA